MIYLILSSESGEKVITTASLLIMKLWFQLVRIAEISNYITVIKRKMFMVPRIMKIFPVLSRCYAYYPRNLYMKWQGK